MVDPKKPTALENAARMILRALDVDVDALKTETMARIAQFERNVKTLNDTLIQLHEGVARLEKKLDEHIARQKYDGGRVETINGEGAQS